jgi:hypothetical protein
MGLLDHAPRTGAFERWHRAQRGLATCGLEFRRGLMWGSARRNGATALPRSVAFTVLTCSRAWATPPAAGALAGNRVTGGGMISLVVLTSA